MPERFDEEETFHQVYNNPNPAAEPTYREALAFVHMRRRRRFCLAHKGAKWLLFL